MNIEISSDVSKNVELVNRVNGLSANMVDNAGVQLHCADCDSLVIGNYCHQCGQKLHIHHSLWHMVEELLHGLLHFETKSWRTIPELILRPGELSRNYVRGQRTRFVSPLALFLFLIVLMFFVFSLGNQAVNQTLKQADTAPIASSFNQDLNKKLLVEREQLSNLELALKNTQLDAQERHKINEDIVRQKKRISVVEGIFGTVGAPNDEKKGGLSEIIDQSSPQSVHANLQRNLPFLATPQVEEKISYALRNPDLTLYKMKSAASKFAFLLVPISLPFLWIMFAFRRRHSMFEHTVFSLYSLSFMAILMMLCSLLGNIGWYALSIISLVLIPPLHMFRQLQGAYQLSFIGTLWRTLALLLVAISSLSLFAMLVLGLSV